MNVWVTYRKYRDTENFETRRIVELLPNSFRLANIRSVSKTDPKVWQKVRNAGPYLSHKKLLPPTEKNRFSIKIKNNLLTLFENLISLKLGHLQSKNW